MALSDRVARLRAKSGLSLSQVAKRIGVTKGNVWEIESGKTKNPRLATANGLAKLFGVSLDYLANGNVADWIQENAETMPEAMEARRREVEERW